MKNTWVCANCGNTQSAIWLDNYNDKKIVQITCKKCAFIRYKRNNQPSLFSQ